MPTGRPTASSAASTASARWTPRCSSTVRWAWTGRDRAGRHAAYVRNHAFFDAPHAVFIFMPHPFDTREATDIGMYAQTLMLAFTARGIASCAQGALGLYPNIVRRHLGLPAGHKLLFGISFGLRRSGRQSQQCTRGPRPAGRSGGLPP